MVLGSLLSLAAIAAMLVYVSKVKGISPVGPYDLWRAATAPLRDVHRALPPVLVLPLWFIGIWIADVFGSMWLMVALFIAFPVALVYETIRVGIPTAIGAAIGLASGLTADAEPDRDNFALPIDVYESDAEDVNQWTDSAMHIPRRSLLTLGASGAGKSNALKILASQLNNNPESPVICYDHKRDYQEFFESRGASMIRLSSEGSQTEMGNPVAWNLFNEIEREDDADEIARAMFPENKSGGDEYFPTAGRQLLAATIIYLRRELDNPTNKDLVTYWNKTDRKTMHEDLTSDGHEDLTAAASSIDPDATGQASGVFSSSVQQVKDLFVGDFAKEGSFSVREYMENPQGRILVLDMPTRQAKTIGPLFKFLIDQSIMHGMADPSRPAYYLLDEIDHMSEDIDRLDELVNVGRGNSCQLLLSLQSIAQLESTYGEKDAHSILSGMTTSIILQVSDSESVEYARETIGTSFVEYTKNVEREQAAFGNGMVETSRETKMEEEYRYAKGDFRQFEPGEAIIARQGEGHVHGRIQEVEE